MGHFVNPFSKQAFCLCCCKCRNENWLFLPTLRGRGRKRPAAMLRLTTCRPREGKRDFELGFFTVKTKRKFVFSGGRWDGRFLQAWLPPIRIFPIRHPL